MRNPHRINEIMPLIQKIWGKNPDMRFFQLISMLEWEYSKRNHDFGKRELVERELHPQFPTYLIHPHPVVDLFHLEDGLFKQFLEEFMLEKGWS